MPASVPTSGRHRAIALDLDGVIWRGSRPIPGSARAVGELQEAGLDLAFVSNNSTAPADAVAARLASMGVAASPEQVLTSARAAAAHLAAALPAGARVLVVGEAGISEALREVGLVALAADARAGVAGVVVGLDRSFDYSRLDAAMQAVRSGAVFVGTNTDPTLPVEDGLRPGSGAMIAAIAAASESEPQVAGKPHPPMAALVRARLGERGIVVGDRADTDGALAEALGWPFALVLSGVTRRVGRLSPDYVERDLAALAPRLVAAAGDG